VGNTIIKQFEIVVRVPPRIKDESIQVPKSVREGDSVQFSCFASGTPKPNITWYVLNQHDSTFRLLPQTDNYLRVENITRYSPRKYQCRASNNIPPSDTRNLTFSVECKYFFVAFLVIHFWEKYYKIEFQIKYFKIFSQNLLRKVFF
jgi:hypothetical protein